MEYTELSAYDVPAGVVTTWTPTCDPARWRDDHRALAPNHEAHLAAHEPGAWIGSIMRIPAPLDHDVLSRTVAAWFARHEALRTSVAGERGAWRRRTLPADAVGVAARDLGPQTGDRARDTIAEFFSIVGPAAWPHCVLATVADPRGDAFTLAFGADHSVMDAYSQLLWFDEIASLYARAAAGEDLTDLAATQAGSHADHAHAERLYAESVDVSAEPVGRWRDFLEAHGFPAFPVPEVAAPALHIPRPRLRQAGFATWLADAERAAALNRACKALGTTVQSGVLAAMAQSFRRVHGVERFRFVVPVHTRSSPEHAAAVGWYVGLCPVDIDLTGLTDLPGIVGHVHERVAAGRELARVPVPRVMELLDVDDKPHFAVSYVDGRFVPGADRWDGWQARALRSPVYADDEVYLWFGRTAAGLNVSARYPETIAAERAMRDLVDGVAAVIQEVTAPVLAGKLGTSA